MGYNICNPMSSFLIARQNLFSEKGRLLITAGGVAFSVILILLLLGLYQGWSTQITKSLGAIDTDLWVGQKGSRDLSHSLSLLPIELLDRLQNDAQVKTVSPFIARQLTFELNGKEAHLYLMGVDSNNLVKPYKIKEGKNRPLKGEIIIDQAFAQKENVRLGDSLMIQKKSFRVVGISEGGNLLVYTFALVEIDELKEILNFNQFTNYYLIKTDGDVKKAKEVLREELPNLSVITKEEFIKNNAALLEETFLPIIGVLLLIAALIGIAVIGLTIFTAAVEKSREYGVLKAIGFTDQQLFAISLIQSIIAGFFGLLAGNVLAPLLALLAQTITDGFLYQVGFPEIILVAVLTLIMSVVASLLPLRRILSIDPAQVFKA